MPSDEMMRLSICGGKSNVKRRCYCIYISQAASTEGIKKPRCLSGNGRHEGTD